MSALVFAEDFVLVRWKPVPLRRQASPPRNPLQKVKILQSAKFLADPLQGILCVLSKSAFKHLILETPLWQGAMSSSLKSPPKGLKDSEYKKGTLSVWPPILYVPPADLHEKWEPEQIKVIAGWNPFPDVCLWKWEQQGVPHPCHCHHVSH
jgi:hypothetical protein